MCEETNQNIWKIHAQCFLFYIQTTLNLNKNIICILLIIFYCVDRIN